MLTAVRLVLDVAALVSHVILLVVFGDPIFFPAGTAPQEATAQIQAAVAAL